MKKTDLGITAIVLLGFVLRLTGISFGLPHLYHADEPIVVNHALAYGAGDLNPHFFKIPPLVSYLLFLCYGVWFWVGRGIGIFKSVQDFELLFLRDPSFFYLLARFVLGVLPGTLAIGLLYRLIRRFFYENVALVTSFLFATAFLPVRDSHYIYLDVPLQCILIVAFYPILKIAEGNRESFRDHLWVGSLLGLATATKYNGVALVIPYLCASLVNGFRRETWKGWFFSACAAMLVYSLANPYTWLDFPTFWKEISQQAGAEGRPGLIHHLTYSLLGGVGPLALILAAAGWVKFFLFSDKKKWPFLFFVAVYYLLLSIKSQPYDRYVLPLVPFVLFLAADFLVWLNEKMSIQKNLLLWIAVFFVAAPSLAKSIFSDALFLQKDLRTEIKEWIEADLPAGSKLALDGTFFMPQLQFAPEQLKEKLALAKADPHFSHSKLKRLEFLLSDGRRTKKTYFLHFLSEGPNHNGFLFSEPRIPYEFRALKEKGMDYVLIARLAEKYQPSNFYEELQKEDRLVKRFTPYRDSKRQYPIDQQPLTGGPFLWSELISREHNGQPVEIYQLK